MATTIEFDSLRKINILLGISLLKSFSSLLLQIVEIVHISQVMLAVVELHQTLRDDWLKAIDSVRKRLLDSLDESSEVPHLNFEEWLPGDDS